MQNATAAAISCVPVTAQDGTVLCLWANNPDTRGTVNILWLCSSTLGLCVWNAVHPDVPYPGTPKWRVIGKRIWWLFVGLFMPEMLVLTALGQFRQAYSLLVRVRRESRVPTELPWWMRTIERLRPTPLAAHKSPSLSLSRDEVLSPNLRTRAVSPPLPSLELEDVATSLPSPAPDALPPAPSEDAGTAEHAAEAPERQHAWTLTHSFYAIMHGFVSAEGDAFWANEEEDGSFMPVFDLDNAVKRIAAPLGDTVSIPDISANDLSDRSKAGFFAKLLLVWQFSVFVANCVARWNQRLPLSLLEITTLAHSLCSLISLALWWYKPHSVGEATVIDQTRADFLPPPPRPWANLMNRAVSTVLPGKNLLTFSSTIAICAIAPLYGLPHLLGLSVDFPTPAEQLCWKLATLVVIGGPLVMCYSMWNMILDHDGTETENLMGTILIVLFFVLIPLYPVANMFIVGESVRQIFALPEASFHEPQLTRYLPSFS